MTSNTAIWDALSKTDPKHTKGFKRAGGFSGTAVKPQWVVSRLTEQFGPVGVGWGMGEPSFETVTAGGEVLVYCTVSAWHGNRENVFYGVGGDKVMVQRQNGAFVDDEAFKKAFTDALMNAFKFVGVAADVHMGLFDDNKYVQAMNEEFKPRITSEQGVRLVELMEEVGVDRPKFLAYMKAESVTDISADDFDRAIKALEAKRTK